jgi:hypothetical protein
VWAWFLDQKPADVPHDRDTFWDKVQDILPPGCAKRSDIAYGQFMHWGRAAGLLAEWSLKAPSGRPRGVTVVNPAPFFRRHLGEVMTPGREMPVNEWLKALGDRFPIFDGGRVRQQVREARKLAPPGPVFSPSLELALRQLHDEGLLTWRPETDAPAYALTLSADDPVAHLTYQPGGRA